MQLLTLSSINTTRLVASRHRLASNNTKTLGPRRTNYSTPIRAFKEDDRQDTPYKVKTGDAALVPAFTRRRERFVGRLASIGVACMWIGEIWTGLGPLHQLSMETGLPLRYIYIGTAAMAATQLFLGLAPGSPTNNPENQRDVNRRTKGLTGLSEIEPDVNKRINPGKEPGKFFLRNELVLGRTAMLVFAAACLLEYKFNGYSPLAQWGFITPGISLSEAPLWLNSLIVLFFVNGLGVFSKFNTNKDSDTY